MFTPILEAFDFSNNIQGEEYGVVVSLILTLGGGVIKIFLRRANDACRGYGYCRFNVFKKQRELIRRTLTPLRGEIKRDFALDLRKTKLDTGEITSQEYSRCVKAQGTLIKAAFGEGEHELINMVIKNDIPPSGTPERKEYIDDNFPLFEDAIWNYAGERWDDTTHILKYNDRFKVYEDKRERFLIMFDRFLTEARKIGSEAKYGKNKKKKDI